jgi:hypothetical protein
MLGRVALDSNPTDSDLLGSLDWVKLPHGTDKFFKVGFAVQGQQVVGSIYVPPTGSDPVLKNLTNANVEFTAGNIPAAFPAPIQVQAMNRIVVTDSNPHKVTMKISSKTGTFSGFFTHPYSGKKTPFGGIFFQKTPMGCGGFNGSSPYRGAPLQTGTVYLDPVP